MDTTPSTSTAEPALDDTASSSSDWLNVDMTPCSDSASIQLATDRAETPYSSSVHAASGNSGAVDSTPSGSGLQTDPSPLQCGKECQKCSDSVKKSKAIQKKHDRLRKKFGKLEEKYNEILSQQVGTFSVHQIISANLFNH